jgi:HAD superfamily hydrolase (TIGR01549 family)
LPQTEIKALLLDLDDTLLINEMETFEPLYFHALMARIRTAYDPRPFMQALGEATRIMMQNDGTRGTNAQVFHAEFFARIEHDPDEVMALFDQFYETEFETLRRYTAADPEARALVELAMAEGYQVAIATQPLFPLPAILARLRWADVPADEFAYDYISSYEVLGACKPHPHFFRTIMSHLGRAPAECLMVGDSLEADMPARQHGLKTFWVDRGRVKAPRRAAHAQGSLGDLINLIKTGEIHEF